MNSLFASAPTFLLTTLVSTFAIPMAGAHEGTGRAGFKDPAGVEVEGEFYAGKRGYLHGGLGVINTLDADQKVGLVGHFVREDSDGDIFPSLGAEYIRDMGGGFEIEAFSFGYLPVESQHAWAVGLRGSRTFEPSDHLSLSPFFGPSFARVQAIEEATESPVDIGHLMLLGGVALEAGPLELTLFGSHSFFSRDSVGLETHVDLEEMTHFAAYENNDGFARNSLGAELSYALNNWISLEVKYVWLEYEDRIRHAITLFPSIHLGSQWEVFAGFQLLRGDGPDNDLVVTGAAFAF
ncbi:MAG: hypothetical protein V4819_23130 [Verrucomicrobiota bacterium]